MGIKAVEPAMRVVFHRVELVGRVLKESGEIVNETFLMQQGSVLPVQDVVYDDNKDTATIFVSDEVSLYDVPKDKFNILGNQNSAPPTCCGG